MNVKLCNALDKVQNGCMLSTSQYCVGVYFHNLKLILRNGVTTLVSDAKPECMIKYACVLFVIYLHGLSNNICYSVVWFMLMFSISKTENYK